MANRKYTKIEPVKDSQYAKYRLRVGYRGSGYEYTKSFHKTKSAAEKAAKKELK